MIDRIPTRGIEKIGPPPQVDLKKEDPTDPPHQTKNLLRKIEEDLSLLRYTRMIHNRYLIIKTLYLELCLNLNYVLWNFLYFDFNSLSPSMFGLLHRKVKGVEERRKNQNQKP